VEQHADGSVLPGRNSFRLGVGLTAPLGQAVNRHTPLRSIDEALLALSIDKLALVTYTVTEVFVSTCLGAGKFAKKDWDAARAPKNSVEEGAKR
jgi:hypothetical protein